MLSHTFQARSEYLPTLRAKLAELGKAAEKLGQPAPTMVVEREFLLDISEDPIQSHLIAVSIVRVDYDIIAKAGDWQFLASIETLDTVDGVNRNKVAGPRLPEALAQAFCTADQVCQHCEASRRRKQTYLLRDAAGEVKQVGSSCLQTYLGIDPAAALQALTIEATIGSMEDEELRCGTGSRERSYALDNAAAVIVALISAHGFAKSGIEGTSNTGNDARLVLTPGADKYAQKFSAENQPTAEHEAVAKAVVSRLAARILVPYREAPASLGSFDFKIGILLNRQIVDSRDLQLFAAAISMDIGRETFEKAASTRKNEFVPGAAEGAKVELTVTIDKVVMIDSAFGEKRLIKMTTADGYPVTTFYSGSSMLFVPSKKLKVTGTVKRLEDSPKYGKQTILTRVKAFEVAKPQLQEA